VAGFVTRTTNAEEMAGAGRIGAVWQEFSGRSSEHSAFCAPVGLYHDYESDHTGAYSLLVGNPLEREAAPPPGWTVVEVPRAEYLVFRADGDPPASIVSAWQLIWAFFEESAPYVRAYTFDFERFDATGADIHIAVVPR
jgi:predicted transcriptional regulator YdeE